MGVLFESKAKKKTWPLLSDPTHKSFRAEYLPRYEAAVQVKGTPAEDVVKMVSHVQHRDYPLSQEEMAGIYRAVGFEAKAIRHDLDSEEPMRDVYCAVVAWPRNAQGSRAFSILDKDAGAL